MSNDGLTKKRENRVPRHIVPNLASMPPHQIFDKQVRLNLLKPYPRSYEDRDEVRWSSQKAKTDVLFKQYNDNEDN